MKDLDNGKKNYYNAPFLKILEKFNIVMLNNNNNSDIADKIY